MEKLRNKILELRKRLEIANTIAKYKRRYYECRPECLHFLLNEYTPLFELFEDYNDRPADYDIDAIQKELNHTSFKYFALVHDILFENKDPVTY
jgi:hypothetical protein